MSSQTAGIFAQQEEAALRRLQSLRGELFDADPNASVIIPVRSRTQLTHSLALLSDLARYHGDYTLEFILVVDDFELIPEESEYFRNIGVHLVFTEPDGPERAGGTIDVRARGVRAARAGITLHFAPDVRIPDPSALIDWYIESLYSEYQLAYTWIDFENRPGRLSTRLSLVVLNVLRSLKRTLLGVPTTRGCNYAVTRSLFLELYETGQLSADINIGLAARLAEARSRYSKEPRLRVVLSTRKYSARTLLYPARILRSLNYNLRAVPVAFKTTEWINWKVFSEEAEKRERQSPPFAGEKP